MVLAALLYAGAIRLSEFGFSELAAAGDFRGAEAWAAATFFLVSCAPFVVFLLLFFVFLEAQERSENEPP